MTLVLILLTSLLAASAGVLVSLKSATVRQAQQTMFIATLGLGVAGVLAFQVVPANVISALTYNQLQLIIMAILVILDVVFLVISLVTFQRSRLILS